MRGPGFFGNMLPEGPALARMATLAGIRPVDAYGILAAFGRDCAGAIGAPMRADTHLGQRVGGQADIREVTRTDLINEAATWGIREQAERISLS